MGSRPELMLEGSPSGGMLSLRFVRYVKMPQYAAKGHGSA